MPHPAPVRKPDRDELRHLAEQLLHHLEHYHRLAAVGDTSERGAVLLTGRTLFRVLGPMPAVIAGLNEHVEAELRLRRVLTTLGAAVPFIAGTADESFGDPLEGLPLGNMLVLLRAAVEGLPKPAPALSVDDDEPRIDECLEAIRYIVGKHGALSARGMVRHNIGYKLSYLRKKLSEYRAQGSIHYDALTKRYSNTPE